MRALTVDPTTGRCAVVEAPAPTPRPGEVLVEVRLSAVNEMDVQVRAGGWKSQVKRFRRAGPVLTGFEFVGVARSDGERIRSGQRVIGYCHVLNGPRTHAAFACVRESDLQAVPDAIGDEAAAALVVMGLTAIAILEGIRPLSRGDKCLVIGAAGGVGAYAVQLAAVQGAEVTAVCSAANADWVVAQGAVHVRPYETQPALRPDDAFALIIDAPARSSFARASKGLARRGAYVSTNPLTDLGGFALAALSSRRAGWLMMLQTGPEELSRLLTLAEAGVLRPVIDSIHDLTQAEAAFDRFATRGKQGRVLLRIDA